MAYIDASSLSEERGDWLRRGNRYRLGQYGIRDDGGTYSTYAVIGGRGYRTGAGLDSFAKSVRHIKGLVEPEDVTEHHYPDAHGIGSAESMSKTEPFAKDRESGMLAYTSAANDPAFQSALASKYGDANRSRSSRQADVEALASDGDCEAAAYASLFVKHGGPLPDFMYETEYGRKILDAAASHHTEPADNPPRGVPPGTLMQSTWPMRAILGMMFSAIHTEATGEMRKLGFYDSLLPISRHFQNAFALMEAMDEGELRKRDAGEPYNITLYDDDGKEYTYRFNDFMASKYLMQAFPQSRQIPDTMSISTGGLPTSQKMDRKERDIRKRLGRWYNDPSGYPAFAISAGMVNNGRARGSKLNKGNSHESGGGGASLNAIARQGWTLDTTRPFEFGYGGYARHRDAPNNNLKRYVSLQSRRKVLEEDAKRFSIKGRTARKQKESLSDELDRARGDIEGKLREIEDYKAKRESIRAQLEEAKQKFDTNEWGPDEYEKAKADAEALKKNVEDNLTVLYRELRELNSNAKSLSENLRDYDSIARAIYDGMNEIDKELREMEANDRDVKKYLANGKPAEMTRLVKAPSLDELYLNTLLDLEKENPMDWDAKGIGMSRDEDGRLIFDTVTDWRGLNNAYGPEVKADYKHILNTLFKTESETARKLREAGELKDEENRLRNRTFVEVADEYLKAREIDDEDTRKLLIDTLIARDRVGKTETPKGSTRSALDPHAQAEKEKRALEAQLAQRGVSMKDVDDLNRETLARVHDKLLQITDTHDGSTYKLREDLMGELFDNILEYFGMNSAQATAMRRSGGRVKEEIAMGNLGLAVNAMFDKFGGNSDPDAPADTRYHPVVTQERPVRDENGEVVVKELTSEPFDATAGRVSQGRTYDAVDARDDRLNPPEEESGMTEFEAIQATGKGLRGKDRKNALSDKLAEKLGVGQAVPGMVEPSADEPVDEEADEMNDDGADETHDDGADDMNDRKDERKPDDESDGFTKKAKSANDSRRSMSFREVMGEATSKNESAQGLPTWTDMAGADMRGCDVWKDLWRTVYMESGDGTPTKVRMKVIRDERRCARISSGGPGPRARRRIRAF